MSQGPFVCNDFSPLPNQEINIALYKQQVKQAVERRQHRATTTYRGFDTKVACSSSSSSSSSYCRRLKSSRGLATTDGVM